MCVQLEYYVVYLVAARSVTALSSATDKFVLTFVDIKAVFARWVHLNNTILFC